MSLGPVMLDLVGTEISAEERAMLQHPMVGGVILFTRNFASLAQLQALVRELHGLRDPHLIIAVDHEGGRVQRFREEFTVLPPIGSLQAIYGEDPGRARRYAQTLGWLMASELRAVGIDLSFAPVLDLDRGLCSVIGDRAFHRDPDIVARLAQEYISGMRSAGMAATGKHFPGHGAVEADSHLALPVDERAYEELLNEDIVPFRRLAQAGMAAVMMSHVAYPAVDAVPASFSSVWINDVLRGELGFQGAVFSDDLTMAAAGTMGDYPTRARAALQAGCDMVIVCNNPAEYPGLLDALSDLDEPVSHLRLVRLHGRGTVQWDELRASAQWRAAVDIAARCDPTPQLGMDME